MAGIVEERLLPVRSLLEEILLRENRRLEVLVTWLVTGLVAVGVLAVVLLAYRV